MNRAERRRMGKNLPSEPVIQIKVSDIQRIKKDAITDASNIAFALVLGLPLIVLRDKQGWGKKRLSSFIEEVIKQYECFEDGLVTLDEIINLIKNETGVVIEGGQWRDRKEYIEDGRK